MKKFTQEQSKKYKGSEVKGTGFLAFRDLEMVSKKAETDMSQVLDFGCGHGRSTEWLSTFSGQIDGCDIDQSCLNEAERRFSEKSPKFYWHDISLIRLPFSLYTAIFSVLVVFHYSDLAEIKRDLEKCYAALSSGGTMIIVGGTKDLYCREYSTVRGLAPLPIRDGDLARIKLLNLDCEIEDHYWSERIINLTAEEVGFKHLFNHFPIGIESDKQEYKSELTHPPYFYTALRRC